MSPSIPKIEKSHNESVRGHGIKFSEIFKIIRHRKAFVFLIVALAVLGTILGHIVYTPTYTASSRISVKTEQPQSIAMYLGTTGSAWSNRDLAERIHNYVQFIKSNTFLLNVAQALKFKQHSGSLNYSLPKNISIFHKEFWVAIFDKITGNETVAKQQRAHSMVTPIEDISSYLSTVLKVSTNNADHIEVSVTTLDAYTSMTIANMIVKEFTKITNEHDARGLLEVKKLLKDKLESTTSRLKSAEIELIEFKKQNRISSTASQSSIYSSRLNEIEKEIEKLNLKLAENNKLITYYEDTQKNRLNAALGQQDGKQSIDSQAQLAILNQRLDNLRQQKSLMLSQNYDQSHWRMAKVEEEINGTAQAMKTLLQNNPGLKEGNTAESNSVIQEKANKLTQENHLARTKLIPLKKSRDELLALLSKVPQAEQYQLMLQRKLDLEYENFSTLQKKLNEVEIQLVSLDKKVLIDRLSSLPGASKRRSLFLKLLFTSLVGLFFGCIITLLLEYLDSTIRHKSDLEDLGIHFLGEIPDINKDRPNYGGAKSPAQIVTLNSPDSLDAVVFDFVRSRLESARNRSGKTSNSITITSVKPNEGKSFVAANLAVSIGQLGKKVLLVDCDLRCPSIHCYFDLPNDQGMVDLFESDAALEDVVYEGVSNNMDVLTAGWGCKAPTVLIGSEKFRILMRHLRNTYDYVIVDTPPVSAVADSSILSNMTDSVVMVTRYRSTTRHEVLDAQFKIHQMSSKRIHGIINFANDRDDIVTYYPYIVPTSSSSMKDNAQVERKRDDLKNFEEKLKKKRSG